MTEDVRVGGGSRVGVLASFDPGDNYDFDALASLVEGVVGRADRFEVDGSDG